MTLKAAHNQHTNEKMKAFIRKVVFVDITINIAAGIMLLFAPRLVDHILFNEPVLAPWFYTILGIGFLLFAGWQIVFFIRPGGFSVRNLRFVAVLALIPVLALALALISPLGDRLLIIPKIFLWLANVYMLLLGWLYWRLAGEINAKE